MVHVEGALAFWRRGRGKKGGDLPVSEKSQQGTRRCSEDAQRLENPFEHRLALLSGMSCPSTMDRSQVARINSCLLAALTRQSVPEHAGYVTFSPRSGGGGRKLSLILSWGFLRAERCGLGSAPSSPANRASQAAFGQKRCSYER